MNEEQGESVTGQEDRSVRGSVLGWLPPSDRAQLQWRLFENPCDNVPWNPPTWPPLTEDCAHGGHSSYFWATLHRAEGTLVASEKPQRQKS